VWSIGTIARGAYVTAVFAGAEGVQQDVSLWRIIGDPKRGQRLAVTSLEVRRTVSVRFDEAALAKISPFATCVRLPRERTAAGHERVRLPDAPLGVDA